MRNTGMDGGQAGAAVEFNPYAEDPRPNLYNIVKNTRENKVSPLSLAYSNPIERLHEGVVRS